MNSIGRLFRLTTFGESHGSLVGGILDGCPAGLVLDFEQIQFELNRRRPGQSNLTTSRRELDKVHFHSGVFEGTTTGAPIGFSIQNTNQRSRDYSDLKNAFRPSHSDFTYSQKYGLRDYRGGGRSSARETTNWVVAGAIAKQLIPHITFNAYVSSVGTIHLKDNYKHLDLAKTEQFPVRCPDPIIAKKMMRLIEEVKSNGDTIGGVISCVIQNVEVGLGEPIFDKLHARLGSALLSINAAKGVEFGSGFCSSEMTGSQHNDLFNQDGTTKTNYSGGIQGGISNGMNIYFRLAFKPVSTIMQSQASIDSKGNKIVIDPKGRHDPCVVPRAVPVVEALAAIVLADFYLLNKLSRV